MTYYNFHCHSVYSTKDALPEPEEIALKNKELGNDAFCITDHGTMMSFIKAFQIADKLDMQFIPGCEFYILPKDKYWKYNEKNNKEIEVEDFAVKYHHLIAIAKNQKGISSLFSLYNSGEEHYGKVCITEENLFRYSEGLIVTNACASGELIFYLRYGLINEAKDLVKKYKEHFKEDFYLELQFHHLTFINEAEIYNQIVEFARELNIKMIITTDSHFINKEDKLAHDIYKNIFFKDKKYNFEKGCFDSAFDGEGYYIKDEREIREDLKNITILSQKDIDGIINNTVELRNKCEKTEFPRGKGLTDKSKELRELVEKGFQEKRVGTELEQISKERLEEELSVIERMGFTEYFINVYNIIKRAQELGIMAGAARGSAAGSEVCYLINIVKIDPIKNHLMFERFLNPSRWNYPDIDLDFAVTPYSTILEQMNQNKKEGC